CSKLAEQPRRHLVSHHRWSLAHLLRILQHVALQRREDARRAPTWHLTSFLYIELPVAGCEVTDVKAEAAANRRRGRHVRKRFQLTVACMPLVGFAGERKKSLEHRSVVPHHPERLRHLAELLLDEPLRHRPEDAGDLGPGHTSLASHLA